MTYNEYINAAIGCCVMVDENSGVAYVDPAYKGILKDNDLDDVFMIDDVIVSEYDVQTALRLAAERINMVQTAKGKFVLDWVYDVIVSGVNSATTDAENAIFKDFLEYMKAKNMSKENEDKDKKINLPDNMNFSKR